MFILCIVLLVFLFMSLAFVYLDDIEYFYISNSLACVCAIILLIYTIVDILSKGGVSIG